MIPDTDLLRARHRDAFGASFLPDGGPHFHGLKPANSMADDASSPPPEETDQSRDGIAGDWLRLALPTPTLPPPTPPPPPTAPAPSDGRPPLLPSTPPLVAWPGTPYASGFRAAPLPAMALVPWMGQYQYPHHRQEMAPWVRGSNWNIGNPALAVAGSSTLTMLPPTVPEFVARQLAHSPAPLIRRDVRVVSPPRRPQMGVWAVLHAARSQGREPFLPQIPKSYLRIKDGRMTVRLLMKYLVSKLGLEDESEVEITCRGQMLVPSLTLQQVRDDVWCSSETATATAPALLRDSPATDHIMMLHYGRSRSSPSCMI